MEFEWDDDKNKANIKKHGLAFDDAIRIFADRQRISNIDNRFEYGEDRFITIGYIQERLCVVVYTQNNDVIRIISARKANKREQRDHAASQKNN